MKTYEIGIATLNRKDLLQDALAGYEKDFPNVKVHVVDNGNQGIEAPGCIYTQPTNRGVAASWNILCNHILANNDYALIVNDDVYLGYDKVVVDEAIQLAINNGNPDFIRSEMSWSMFLISKELFTQVGGFDEMFYPAYYEDSDYIYRMRLLGIEQAINPRLNPQTYRMNGTYEKAPDLVNAAMQKNQDRYVEKWGGLPLLEEYNIPYGEPNPKNVISHWNKYANTVNFEVLENGMVKVWFKEPVIYNRFGSDGSQIIFVDYPGGPSLSLGDNLSDWIKKSVCITRIMPYKDFVILETKNI